MTVDRPRGAARSKSASADDRTYDLAARLTDLERSVERCERQLRVREEVIRRLRRDMLDARASHDRLVNSRTYRLAVNLRRFALVTRPRAVFAALRKRLTS
jgi:hypothetical protein